MYRKNFFVFGELNLREFLWPVTILIPANPCQPQFMLALQMAMLKFQQMAAVPGLQHHNNPMVLLFTALRTSMVLLGWELMLVMLKFQPNGGQTWKATTTRRWFISSRIFINTNHIFYAGTANGNVEISYNLERT